MSTPGRLAQRYARRPITTQTPAFRKSQPPIFTSILSSRCSDTTRTPTLCRIQRSNITWTFLSSCSDTTTTPALCNIQPPLSLPRFVSRTSPKHPSCLFEVIFRAQISARIISSRFPEATKTPAHAHGKIQEPDLISIVVFKLLRHHQNAYLM